MLENIVITTTPNASKFRLFCTEKWYEHKDEILLWTGNAVEYDSDYYFNKHRWLLKRMYKEQKNA